MKKSVFLFLPLMFLVACGTYRTITVDRLKIGMTRAEVEHIFGRPKRVLAVSQSEYGYQEVLEYETSNNELYALEFMNDQLVSYEFLREDIVYIPPPPAPQPVIIIHEHPYPNYPKPVERPPVARPSPPPSTRPVARPVRTEQGNSRTYPPARVPNTSTSTTRPSDNTRPASSTNTGASRPESRERVDTNNRSNSNDNNRSSSGGSSSVQNRQSNTDVSNTQTSGRSRR